MTILEASRIRSIEVSSARSFDFAPGFEKLYYSVMNIMLSFALWQSEILSIDMCMGQGRRGRGVLLVKHTNVWSYK